MCRKMEIRIFNRIAYTKNRFVISIILMYSLYHQTHANECIQICFKNITVCVKKNIIFIYIGYVSVTWLWKKYWFLYRTYCYGSIFKYNLHTSVCIIQICLSAFMTINLVFNNIHSTLWSLEIENLMLTFYWYCA